MNIRVTAKLTWVALGVAMISAVALAGCTGRRAAPDGRQAAAEDRQRAEARLEERLARLDERMGRLEAELRGQGDRVGRLESRAGEMAAATEGARRRAEAAAAAAGQAAVRAEQAGQAAAEAGVRADRASEAATTALRRPEPAGPPAGGGPVEKVMSTARVGFAFDRWELDDRAQTDLADLVKRLESPASPVVVLEGHTDSVGPDGYNFELSRKRAEAVRRFLVDRGITVRRIEFIGFGETHPAADNATPAGRAQNRQVLIKLLAIE